MKKSAIFPGSFDPFTIGHESVVLRSLDLFDNIVIGVGVNSGKKALLTVKSRVEMINEIFKDVQTVSVDFFEGLTVDFCRKMNTTHILRGIRTAADFEYERAIAQINKKMLPEVESVFLLTNPEHSPVNSTIIRDIIRNNGDASQFLPAGIDINNYL